jgi:hypothetical protein
MQKYPMQALKLYIKSELKASCLSSSIAMMAFFAPHPCIKTSTPPDYGVLCQNVGTVKAIYDAVIDNKPLISRIVTVTGSAVKEPRNYEARLGTSFASVLANEKYCANGIWLGQTISQQRHSIQSLKL